MSSIGTGYDLAASTFSPDGKIFQVEYAQKAVDNSGTIVALAGKNGVVVAVDHSVSSKLIEGVSMRMLLLN
jgi:20S proteasome subunit alpha 7